jgi:quercetin dioxygenase-like cupin family protein
VEFIYTLKGRLNVHIDGQEHALESGDSMYFDSGLPHGYRRGGTSTCCAIVVTTA